MVESLNTTVGVNRNEGIGSSPTPLARLRGVRKRFGPVEVLRGIQLDLWPGEVHILAGENGAGKSTLIKILGGVYSEYDGSIEIDGCRAQFSSPLDARAAGIAVIHQELSLVPSMSVADNLFLGRNITARGGFVSDSAQGDLARTCLQRIGADIPVDCLVERLTIAQQQLVEIAKALAQDARIIVMDEPTSALSAPEAKSLFALIAELKRRGAAIVYITHKMEEIAQLADRITVLRDGSFVGTALASELSADKLIEWIVGRKVEAQFPRHASRAAEICLELKNFSVHTASNRLAKPAVEAINFTLRRGEILGIGGLQGSGASELLGGLFGVYGSNATAGDVCVEGVPLRIDTPRDAIEQGIAMLTNDRKATGLVLSLSILANGTLASLPRVSPGGWIRDRRERSMVEPLARSFRLKAASLRMNAGALSGGNQQKVALAKALATQPKVLLLDEPTRGIDVGAKREIYELMNQWTAAGIGILLITSELPELLALSDRIIVLHRGRLTAEISREQATPERVLRAAMGEVSSVFSDGAIQTASAVVEAEARRGASVV